MPEFKLDAQFSAADVKEIVDGITALRQRMNFLIAMSPDERARTLRPGDNGRAFARRAMEIAEQNPMIMPGNFSINEMRNDVDVFSGLQPIKTALGQLKQLVEDTELLATAESYSAGLKVYQMVKLNGDNEALKSARRELGRLFANRGSSAATQTNEGTETAS